MKFPRLQATDPVGAGLGGRPVNALTMLREIVARTFGQDPATNGAKAGTIWSGAGMVASALGSLVASMVLVANTQTSVFADVAVLTVGIAILGTVFRVGGDRIFVGEVQAARDIAGATSARDRGASLLAFSIFAAVVGGFLVAAGPLASLLNIAMSAPLSGFERILAGAWLASDIARLVVGEGHRWSLRFKLAAFSSSGARAPLFLLLVVAMLASGVAMTREHLILAGAVASVTVFVVSLLALGRRFPWWARNPFGSARELWTGHSLMLATTLAATVIGGSDVWIVGAAIGHAPAARYAFAVSIVAGVPVVSSAVSLGLAPYLAAGLQPGNSQKTSALVVNYTRVASLLAFALYAGLLLFAQPVAVFLGDDYRGVFQLVAILGAGQLVGVIAGPGGNVLILARQYRLIASITVGIGVTMVTITATAAWTTHSEIVVALASGSATAALNVVGSIASQHRANMPVHALHGLWSWPKK